MIRGFITQDLRANARSGSPEGSSPASVLRTACTVRALSIVLLRTAQLLHSSRRLKPLSFAVKQANHLLTGLDWAPDTVVGQGLIVFHPTGVVVGPGVVLGDSCTIQAGVVLGGDGGPGRGERGAPTLGSGAFIGAGAKVLGDVVLADRVTVGANSVVLSSFTTPGATLVGAPARAVVR